MWRVARTGFKCRLGDFLSQIRPSALRGVKFSQRYCWTRKYSGISCCVVGISRLFEGSVPSKRHVPTIQRYGEISWKSSLFNPWFFSSIRSNAALPIIEPRPLSFAFTKIYCSRINPSLDFFLQWRVSPSGPRPHLRGFMITLRHTTLGRTPMEEWSARRRDLYLTPHYPHKRQTSNEIDYKLPVYGDH
jgi:hypothetical protein